MKYVVSTIVRMNEEKYKNQHFFFFFFTLLYNIYIIYDFFLFKWMIHKN